MRKIICHVFKKSKNSKSKFKDYMCLADATKPAVDGVAGGADHIAGAGPTTRAPAR